MEYRISPWMQIIIWLLAFTSCAVMFTVKGPIETRTLVAMGTLILVIAAFIAAINISLTIFYIDNNAVTLRSLVRNRSLAIEDIRGYRLIRTSKSARLIFIPKDNSLKQIAIVVDNFSNSKEIIEFAKSNFQDLNKLLYDEELNSLLQDGQLGVSTEDRKAFLSLRKKMAIAVNILAVASVFFLFLGPASMGMLQLLPLVFCFLALLLVCASRGVVRLIGTSKSPRPTVIIAFIFPPIFFLIYTSTKHSFYGLQSFWLPWAKWSAIVFGLFALLFFTNKRIKEAGAVFLLLGIALIIAAGSLIFFNSYLDKSRPAIYRVEVLNKWKEHNKNTSYFMSVSEWGKYIHGEKESISRSLYETTNIGDTVRVLLHTGKYNIPWYDISTDAAQIGKINAN